MANRNFEQYSYSLIKKKVDIAGYVALSATGAVTSQSIKGAVFAKAGTGEYTLTLEDQYNELLFAHAELAENVEDLKAIVSASDVAGTKVITIKLIDDLGAETDVTATAKIYVHLILKNSGV